jgi:hypothetical protein
MSKKDAGQLLEDAAALYRQRNAAYGGSYHAHGTVVKALFPYGLKLDEPSDFSRYAILDMIIGKLIRYSNNFAVGGHDDSMADISVYAMMLRELDQIDRATKARASHILPERPSVGAGILLGEEEGHDEQSGSGSRAAGDGNGDAWGDGGNLPSSHLNR